MKILFFIIFYPKKFYSYPVQLNTNMIGEYYLTLEAQVVEKLVAWGVKQGLMLL